MKLQKSLWKQTFNMKGYLIGLLSRIALVVCTIFYIVSGIILYFIGLLSATFISIVEAVIIMPLFYIFTGVNYFNKICNINHYHGLSCDIDFSTAGFYIFSICGHWFYDLFYNLLEFLKYEAGRHRLS